MKKALIIIVIMLFFAGCGDEQLTIDGEQLSIDGEQLIIDSEQLTIDEPEEFDVRIEPPEEPEITLSPFEENLIVLTAQSLIGTQFRDGGGSPEEGFDNSGFIHYVLRENGYVNSPRGLQEQAVMGSRIESLVELRSGDLVFFSDNGERAQFGGIYIGDGIMISCRMPGEAVREIDITAKFYRENFFTAVRVL